MKKDKVLTSYMLSDDAVAALEARSLGLSDPLLWELIRLQLKVHLAEGGSLHELETGQSKKRKKSYQVLKRQADWVKKEAKKQGISASGLMNAMLTLLKNEDERERAELVPEARRALKTVTSWKEELKGMKISRFEVFGAAFDKDLERETLFAFDTLLESLEECIEKGETQ